MVDLDNSFEYSKIIIVDTDCAIERNFEIYPNPTSSSLGMLNLKFYAIANETQIQIVDIQGRIVKQLTIESVKDVQNLLQLDVSDLTVGTYHLNIGGENGNSKKFIITQ